jgi:hypothetical protein
VIDPALQNLLDGRRLEKRPVTDDDISGFWNKALTAYRDALLTSSSLDGRYDRAYAAVRFAATALVSCSATSRARIAS